MCLSAEASFGVSALLLPAGAYCAANAVKKNKELLGLAIIPCVFGLQQFCEGLVWTGIDQDSLEFARLGAFFYLYFALSFWPFWIPFCAFLTEHSARKKLCLAFFTLLGLVGGLVLYVPLVLNPEVLIPKVRNHSIAYDITRSVAFQMIPRAWWQVLYIATVGLPLLISPSRGFPFLGIALVVAAAVSHFYYWYAFISVWCFFASLLSLYLCISFWQLPLPINPAEKQEAAT